MRYIARRLAFGVGLLTTIACSSSDDGKNRAETTDASDGAAMAGSGGVGGNGGSRGSGGTASGGSASGGAATASGGAAGSGGTAGAGGTAGSGGTAGTGGTATGVGGRIGGTGGGLADGGPVDSDGGVGTLPCGAQTCNLATETCAANPNQPAAFCYPSDQHPCTGGCFVADCDGPEDCPQGEACVSQLGENNYFRCAPLTWGPHACSRAADCPIAAPRCVPLGNAAAIEAVLGWVPGSCSP